MALEAIRSAVLFVEGLSGRSAKLTIRLHLKSWKFDTTYTI